MFRIALCDDKIDFLKQEYEMTKNYLTSIGELFEISKFTSGRMLINEGKIESYDLILLDYDMVGMNGFETAKRIREISETPCIAFVTVFYEFSRAAYRFDAIRYLVKNEPTFEEELQDCINRAIQIMKSRKDNRRQFNFLDRSLVINPEKIVYIQVRNHYLDFFIIEGTSIKKFSMRETMGSIQEQLSDTQMFSLVRAGQLINLKYITNLNQRGFISLLENEDQKKFRLSDSKKKQFMSDYMRYRGGV
ncbi:MAG: response regulator transcription factor [Clostridiales bacterium]|nr:response regulator transcription factor [Clostridiales bacterium]MBP5416524.1 response regulator transcription factor [Clostridiales bacterium]